MSFPSSYSIRVASSLHFSSKFPIHPTSDNKFCSQGVIKPQWYQFSLIFKDRHLSQQNFYRLKKYGVQYHPYKQKTWKISCIFVRIFDGWWEPESCADGGGGSSFFPFFLLSWKNCCITSAHSKANTPRRMVIFGWNGWTGAAGLSDNSEPFPPSPPSGKSLQK